MSGPSQNPERTKKNLKSTNKGFPPPRFESILSLDWFSGQVFQSISVGLEYLQSNYQNALAFYFESFFHLGMTFLNDAGNPGFSPLFLQVTCNCFTISNGEMQDVGVGLYPSMSLLNHSCDPNCVIVFEGRQLLLRSVREIQIGEELTISYIESLMPSSERQKHLKRQYCFECNCLLCKTQEKDADMLTGEEKAWKEIKDLRLITEWEQVLAMCQTLLNNSADRLPDTNIYLLKMLDCAMDACINLRRWEEALLYGNRTLKPYSFHPLRAVQMMRVGKLQHTQDMFPQALETLKQAYNIMKVTHGADHSLVQDLMKLKEQCEADMRAQ
uniref:[histone H3]-lysine(4) N-trimethyltransferase n=1 Tax=Gopherus agassizii TaxID=38772 RepID=A0A452J5Y6_9SAUR